MKIKNMYHRKDGRWEYVKIKDGQKIYLIAGTQEKLYQKIKSYKESNKTKTSINKDDKNTVIGWTKYWLKVYKKDISESTKSNYEICINYHMEPFFKDMPLSKLTPAKVQEYLNQVNPGTRTQEFAYLTIRQALKYAFANGKIALNMSEMIIKPKRTIRKKKTALSLKEQKQFFKILKSYDQDIQYFMLFSLIAGTRRAETNSFDLNDIDEKKQRIHIKGTKTSKSDRRISVTNDFISYLKAKDKTNPYFSRTPNFYTKTAVEIFRKAKIKNKSLHDLRHTCSTNLFYLGWADVERQQYLGHASIIMTNDIYTNLQEDITRKDLIKLYNNLYIIK